MASKKTNNGSGAFIAKLIAILLFIAILAGGVGALLYFSEGFTNWNPKTWTVSRGSDQGEEEEPSDGGDDGEEEEQQAASGLIVETNSSKYITLSSAVKTTSADDSSWETYVITATLSPEYPTDQTITASLAWADEAAEWAEGKSVTDYATAEVDGLEITVTCKAAFGEQIIMTVAPVSAPDVTASCTLDYLKRIESIELSFLDSDGEAVTAFDYGSTYSISYKAVYGTGTLYPDDVDYQLSLALTDEAYAGIQSEVLYPLSFIPGYWSCSQTSKMNLSDTEAETVTFSYLPWLTLEYSDDTSEGEKLLQNYLYTICGDGATVFTTTLTLAVSYNGTVYDSASVTLNCTYAQSSLTVTATGITLSDDSVIF